MSAASIEQPRTTSRLASAGAGLFWAITWGVGVALGVALGAWLTAVGGVGAPGASSIDPAEDLILVPVLAGLAVTLVHIVGQAVARIWRARSR